MNAMVTLIIAIGEMSVKMSQDRIIIEIILLK